VRRDNEESTSGAGGKGKLELPTDLSTIRAGEDWLTRSNQFVSMSMGNTNKQGSSTNLPELDASTEETRRSHISGLV
jgi:hypothetical protein